MDDILISLNEMQREAVIHTEGLEEPKEPVRNIYPVGAQLKHKVFGEAIIEQVDEATKTL